MKMRLTGVVLASGNMSQYHPVYGHERTEELVRRYFDKNRFAVAEILGCDPIDVTIGPEKRIEAREAGVIDVIETGEISITVTFAVEVPDLD